MTVYGGVAYYGQLAALRRDPDVIIATPGRLIDLLKQKSLTLDLVAHFILDEAMFVFVRIVLS